MDNAKKAAFVKMGKRQKFSKGGMIRKIAGRHYFDDGGDVNKNVIGTPTAAPLLTGSSNLTNLNAVNPNTGIAGTIGNALGLNDQFQAGSANITPGTNVGQLNTAYTGAQGALANQGNIVNTLNPQVAGAAGNQNALAAQELALTQGIGPNPALTQLAQTTGTNVANQAALQAGQRGASGNVGLMARQIGQQGAATQQQAVSQGATLEAQQQLAAEQNLAGLSNQQVVQAQGANTAQNTAQQGEQNILQGANTSANNAAVGMQSNINNVNSATALANQQESQGIIGGLFSGASAVGGKVGSALSSIGSSLGFAHGGEIAEGPHSSHVANFLFAKGGKVPAMVSPGEIYLNPEQVRQVVQEGKNPLKIGKKIPGKPKVKGDSLKNDIVPADLEDGGVIIPRRITTKKMAAEKAELFVHRAHARRKASK